MKCKLMSMHLVSALRPGQTQEARRRIAEAGHPALRRLRHHLRHHLHLRRPAHRPRNGQCAERAPEQDPRPVLRRRNGRGPVLLQLRQRHRPGVRLGVRPHRRTRRGTGGEGGQSGLSFTLQRERKRGLRAPFFCCFFGFPEANRIRTVRPDTL